MVSITRNRESEVWDTLPSWKMVFGRRKTGKTYFVKHFTDYDDYFLVGRDGTIYGEETAITYDALLEVLKRGRDSRIIIDEFHRLPSKFQDFIQTLERKREFVLLTSTLNLSKKILGRESPILGLFADMPFSLIDERDILHSMSDLQWDTENIFESGVYMRDPWVVPYFEKGRGRKDIYAMALGIRTGVPALMGEIFSEEHRSYARTYDGILRAVGSGKVISTEISDFLFSRGILEKNNPSLIQPHLNILITLGILERIPMVPGRKYVYKHVSPVVDMFYYLDEKYLYSERQIDLGEIKGLVNESIPGHVEDYFRKLFSLIHGGMPAVLLDRKKEVDIGVVKFKKVLFAAEVKWKNHISSQELSDLEDKLKRFENSLLIVKREDSLPRTPSVDYATPKDVLDKYKDK